MRGGFYIFSLFALLAMSVPARSENIADPDEAEAKAEQLYTDHFKKFTQDKEVAGKASLPDGTIVGGGRKRQFDKDNGFQYEADYTYHSFAYRSRETVNAKDPNDPDKKEDRPLFEFVSSHGKESGAGGSSELERRIYALHQKYADEEKRKEKDGTAQKEDDEEGIKYKSIFKVETREVKPKANQAAAGPGGTTPPNPDPKQKPDKVERVTPRDDVRKAADDLGVEVADRIERSARDEENQNNPSVLGNITLLYEAAKRATAAWYHAAVASLAQRRVNDTVFGANVQLSEAIPSCESWKAIALQEELQNETNPQRREDIEKRIESISQKCKEVAALPPTAINPKFEVDKNGKEQLKETGPRFEDPIQRDLRAQVEALNSPSKSVGSVTSDWQYSGNDDKTSRKAYSDGGSESGTASESMQDQIEIYNEKLERAESTLAEAKKRAPEIPIPAGQARSYKINGENSSAMDINQLTESQLEEFGVKDTQPTQVSKTYDKLLDSAASLNGR